MDIHRACAIVLPDQQVGCQLGKTFSDASAVYHSQPMVACACGFEAPIFAKTNSGNSRGDGYV